MDHSVADTDLHHQRQVADPETGPSCDVPFVRELGIVTRDQIVEARFQALGSRNLFHVLTEIGRRGQIGRPLKIGFLPQDIGITAGNCASAWLFGPANQSSRITRKWTCVTLR